VSDRLPLRSRPEAHGRRQQCVRRTEPEATFNLGEGAEQWASPENIPIRSTSSVAGRASCSTARDMGRACPTPGFEPREGFMFDSIPDRAHGTTGAMIACGVICVAATLAVAFVTLPFLP
jgi:hypothetical protein